MLALVVLGACSDPHARQAEEAARLLATDQAFSRDAREGGTAEAFYAYLADDALELSASAGPIEGRAAIRDHLKPLGMHTLAWTPRRAEVAASLDLGWTWGEWRLLASARSGEVLSRGQYVNVWTRDATGHWKVRVDIGNEIPAPEAPPAEAAPSAADPARPAPDPAPDSEPVTPPA